MGIFNNIMLWICGKHVLNGIQKWKNHTINVKHFHFVFYHNYFLLPHVKKINTLNFQMLSYIYIPTVLQNSDMPSSKWCLWSNVLCTNWVLKVPSRQVWSRLSGIGIQFRQWFTLLVCMP